MSLYNLSDIIFPHLGITVENLPMGISVFGFEIAFYGVIVATAMLVGYLVAEHNAKRFSIDPENVMDFAIIVIIVAIIGARAYYVIFHWDSFKDAPLSILNLRTGGLAIYGGVIAAIITAVVFCKVKKIRFGSFADVCIPGLLIGQVIGRWANFFNREAFGSYTDNIFAMQMDVRAVGGDYLLTEAALRNKYAGNEQALEKILEQLSKNVTVDGVSYIQAHPTFLYESLWNLGAFILVSVYAKYKRFHGELLAWYAVLYGAGRFWIESLRTDQLFFFSTNIPVSQIVAIIMIAGGLGFIVFNYIKLIRAGEFKAGAQIEVKTGVKPEKVIKKEAKKDQPKSGSKVVIENGAAPAEKKKAEKKPDKKKTMGIKQNPNSKVKIEE